MYNCGDVVIGTDFRQPAENYLKVVIHPPPSHFSVSPFLSTNGKYHHGIHISNNQDDRSSNSLTSWRRSPSEYDIWRSWDDCLRLQQSLEDEYKQAAREKKKRLIQGKGVKGFNGLYKQDFASSWESLPPGPNPSSVAQDIHEYLPSLTKKGTLFRASQATIDQRQAELTPFLDALFSDNMPSLIKEIRGSTIISDFFGYWRRDCKFAEESQKAKAVRRDSVTSSIFSSYFLPSHPTLTSSDTSPPNSPPMVPPKVPRKGSQPSATPCPLSFSSPSEISEEPRYPCESPKSRSRPHSTSSDSSAQSESSFDTSLSLSTSPTIVDDVPIVFGHNPSNPSDLSNSILEVLPEERDIFSKPPGSYQQARPRPRVSAIERKANRSYSIFGPSRKESLHPAENSGDRSVRESWQTTDSQDSIVNELVGGLGLILPHPIKEHKFRASVASISTFMTTDSADAVIPQTPTTATASQSRSFTLHTNLSAPLILSDFDVYPDEDYYSVLDAFPCPPESRPGNSMDDLSLPESPSSTCTAFNYSASETCSTLSSSAFSAMNSTSFLTDSISIKAIHATSIILLRVSREIGLADVRQRLYTKFIVQEGIPLSETYNIAFVPPNPASPTGTNSQSVAFTNRTDTQLITLESDWKQLISTLQGSKITLRILDIPSI